MERELKKWADKQGKKPFNWGGTTALEEKTRDLFKTILQHHINIELYANSSITETTALLKLMQAKPNKISHLDKTPLPDHQLRKLSKKTY